MGNPVMTDDTFSNQRGLPNLERCLTWHLGETLAFSYCLVENPDCCEHAARLGSIGFCSHPDRRSFEKSDTP